MSYSTPITIKSEEEDELYEFPVLKRTKSFAVLPELESESCSVIPEKVVFLKPKPTAIDLYRRLVAALLENADDGESYEGAVKQGNIILDMDGTLGDNIPLHFPENPNRYVKTTPIPRPGLRKFLRYVFAHYENVSIWTAALPVWYAQFKETVLIPNMPEGAKFHFERMRNAKEPYTGLKPLREIYEKYPEYNELNTTIVDDNVETFRENKQNGVHIPSFFYDLIGRGNMEQRIKNAAKDRGLFTIIEVLNMRRRMVSLVPVV